MNFKLNARGGWIVPANTVIPTGTVSPAHSEFGYGCKFGFNCKFGSGCKFGYRCKFEDYCKFGPCCKFEYKCQFGPNCKFRDYSEFGTGCDLGKEVEIGCGIKRGGNFKMEGVVVQKLLTVANLDGSGRQVLLIKHKGGILVRAGCFVGTPEEFCSKAEVEGKLLYVDIVKFISNRLLGEDKS